MKCPRCAHEKPSHAKFCPECGMPFGQISEGAAPHASHLNLQRALNDTREQQLATGEILHIIATSPKDVQPVLNLLSNAIKFTPARGRIDVRRSRVTTLLSQRIR